MDKIILDYLSHQPSMASKEAALFKLVAVCPHNQVPHLLRQLIALPTPASIALCQKLLVSVADKRDLYVLKPHAMNVVVHNWLLDQKDWDFLGWNPSEVLEWLLKEEWSAYGIDLWQTFMRILNRIKSSPGRHGLGALYSAAQHLPGAASEIEKIVLAQGFIRQDDPQRRWYKRWDEDIYRQVVKARYLQALRATPPSPTDVLAQAISCDKMLTQADSATRLLRSIGSPNPDDDSIACIELAIGHLLDEFVQRTHLTLHSGSSLYYPSKAREILDALAGLRTHRHQRRVLWEINRWTERHEGLGSLSEDSESLRRNLLVPLWWRYSTETRLEFLRYPKFGHHPHWDGQSFLIEEMMGLRYDPDEDFRRMFNQTLDLYRSPDEDQEYEPRPLQELWEDKELSYEIVDDCPPELVRRVAVQKVDWDHLESGEMRWSEARDQARQLLDQRETLRDYVSAEKRNYAIDNLLGSYFPIQRNIVLYRHMIHHAANDLGVDRDALTTVAYIHETAHAFSHLGRDLDNRMWEGFPGVPIESPDAHLSKPHEAIAQWYTFKLLEWLGDKQLLNVFSALEKSCDEIYRAWRHTEYYSLETMREVLVGYRRADAEWPPDRSR